MPMRIYQLQDRFWEVFLERLFDFLSPKPSGMPDRVNIVQPDISLVMRVLVETSEPAAGFPDFDKKTESSMRFLRRIVVPAGFRRPVFLSPARAGPERPADSSGKPPRASDSQIRFISPGVSSRCTAFRRNSCAVIAARADLGDGGRQAVRIGCAARRHRTGCAEKDRGWICEQSVKHPDRMFLIGVTAGRRQTPHPPTYRRGGCRHGNANDDKET